MTQEASHKAQDLAKALNDVEYRSFPKELMERAKSERLLIVSGSSDDLIELNGIITDEVGAGRFRLRVRKSDGKPDIEPLSALAENLMEIVARYGYRHPPHPKVRLAVEEINEWMVGPGFSVEGAYARTGWEFVADIPFAKFAIREDGEILQYGLVIDLADIKAVDSQIKTA